MKFLSLQPFVPSGENFGKSKELFLELGFQLQWEAGGYAGFEKDSCSFILQQFHNPGFAENFMITVRIDDVEKFRQNILERKLPELFGITISGIKEQPYGKEVNLIDLAGVCWHFVE